MIPIRCFFKIRLALVCCICFFIQSCGARAPAIQQLNSMPEDGVCRVAVLPFVNQSDYRDGGVLLYRVFAAELARQQNFDLSQEGDVRTAFRQIQMNPFIDRPSFDQLRIIGDYLAVDILVIGRISEMYEKIVQGKSIPHMVVFLELINAKNGRPILNIHHRRSGSDYLKVMHFGLVTTTTELSQLISTEIIGDLIKKGFVARCTE